MATNVDLKMPEHNLKKAKEMARAYYYKNTPCYLWGPPGVGKSAGLRQVAQEEKIGFIDVRLGSKLPEDLHGIPVPDIETQRAIWLKADFWPDEERDGPKGIIVFDEMSDTSKAIQSATYQIVLDRCIGNFKLLPGWWPVAAGNRREDRAAAQAVSTALCNRFAHIDVRADYDTWREYANVKQLHPFMVAFLKMRPDLLHLMTGSDLRAFPSPRAWEEACKFVDEPPSIRQDLICGLVGPGAAAEFEAKMRGVTIPDIEDIVADPKGCMIPKEAASRYALSSMLAQNISKKNFERVSIYIKRGELGRDFEVVTILDAVRRDKELMNHKPFNDFAERNGELIL